MQSANACVNVLRMLSIDAIERAKSGHPGAPMGMAEMAYALWKRHMRHNPANPKWFNRDRFVLSNGHASMLLYAVLHLAGYDLSMQDLRCFRQWRSRTPGHPEVEVTPGVETTTGPLGQGLANAVGFALAERQLAETFNRAGFPIVDHYTYAFVGDGCLMEGISHEVCSLAGTQGLGKLIVLYDDNGISIDGKVVGWCADDVIQRFLSYGWHVIAEIDAHDVDAVDAAVQQAKAEQNQPSLLCCRSEIGRGSQRYAGSARVHGAPLGAEEAQQVRQHLGWPFQPFEVPAAVYEHWDARATGQAQEAEWQALFAAYAAQYPDLSQECLRRISGKAVKSWEAAQRDLPLHWQAQHQASMATRKASLLALKALYPYFPELLGGSADLSDSNLTRLEAHQPISKMAGGDYLHYGVREFGMFAVMNGLALHGGFIPYGGTFLVFSDYARAAIRMAAQMKLRTIFVLSHDSVGLGEDGATHQPVEHLSSLRLIPGLEVWRPCDSVETLVAWMGAVDGDCVAGPTALCLSRQGLPACQRTAEQVEAISRGAYVLCTEGEQDVGILIATGSEVSLAIAVHLSLKAQGIFVRVVSMPCASVFDRQTEAWQTQVLPPDLPRVAMEAGSSAFWYRYTGLNGAVIGIDTFGESAPGAEILHHFGFEVEQACQVVRDVLGCSSAKVD